MVHRRLIYYTMNCTTRGTPGILLFSYYTIYLCTPIHQSFCYNRACKKSVGILFSTYMLDIPASTIAMSKNSIHFQKSALPLPGGTGAPPTSLAALQPRPPQQLHHQTRVQPQSFPLFSGIGLLLAVFSSGSVLIYSPANSLFLGTFAVITKRPTCICHSLEMPSMPVEILSPNKFAHHSQAYQEIQKLKSESTNHLTSTNSHSNQTYNSTASPTPFIPKAQADMSTVSQIQGVEPTGRLDWRVSTLSIMGGT